MDDVDIRCGELDRSIVNLRLYCNKDMKNMYHEFASFSTIKLTEITDEDGRRKYVIKLSCDVYNLNIIKIAIIRECN